MGLNFIVSLRFDQNLTRLKETVKIGICRENDVV